MRGCALLLGARLPFASFLQFRLSDSSCLPVLCSAARMGARLCLPPNSALSGGWRQGKITRGLRESAVEEEAVRGFVCSCLQKSGWSSAGFVRFLTPLHPRLYPAIPLLAVSLLKNLERAFWRTRVPQPCPFLWLLSRRSFCSSP